MVKLLGPMRSGGRLFTLWAGRQVSPEIAYSELFAAMWAGVQDLLTSCVVRVTAQAQAPVTFAHQQIVGDGGQVDGLLAVGALEGHAAAFGFGATAMRAHLGQNLSHPRSRPSSVTGCDHPTLLLPGLLPHNAVQRPCGTK